MLHQKFPATLQTIELIWSKLRVNLLKLCISQSFYFCKNNMFTTSHKTASENLSNSASKSSSFYSPSSSFVSKNMTNASGQPRYTTQMDKQTLNELNCEDVLSFQVNKRIFFLCNEYRDPLRFSNVGRLIFVTLQGSHQNIKKKYCSFLKWTTI